MSILGHLGFLFLLSNHLFIYLFIYLSIYLFPCLFIYLPHCAKGLPLALGSEVIPGGAQKTIWVLGIESEPGPYQVSAFCAV